MRPYQVATVLQRSCVGWRSKTVSKRPKSAFFLLLCLTAVSCSAAAAQEKPPDLIRKVQEISFSFVYDGKSSHEFMSSWKRRESRRVLPTGVHQKIVTYADPQKQLQVVCEISQYPESHAAEWLLRFKNNGRHDSAILQNILPLDLTVSQPKEASFVLHSAYGSPYGDRQDFTPIDKNLSVGDELRSSHYLFENGEQSYSYLPFFNLQWDDGGVIGAIGWTGQWMLHVQRSANGALVQSGQETTHFKLHPGEEVRTPRILLLQWDGKDRMVGQNELRRLLLAYYVPRIDGEVAVPPVAHTGAYVCIFDDVAKKTGENPLNILPNLQDSDLGKRFVDPDASLNCVTEQNQLHLIVMGCRMLG